MVTPPDVRAALRGDKAAVRALLNEIGPIVEARAVRAMMRFPKRGGASAYDTADLVQESFARLFADGGRALRNWSPERGMSLRNWVGMIAERTVLTFLRRRELMPANSECQDPCEVAGRDPLGELESRSELIYIAQRLSNTLSTQRLQLFTLLCVDREDVSDAAARVGVSEQALYASRARMERLARALVRDTQVD